MKVAIIMSSIEDRPVAEEAMEICEKFKIEYETKVISSHRTPQAAIAFAEYAENNGFSVIICCAGMSANLPGIMASLATIPVIGVPVDRSPIHGVDALLAVAQMSPGVPVATMAINGGKNAALLAAQILALSNSNVKDKLRYYKKELAMEVDKMNEELKK